MDKTDEFFGDVAVYYGEADLIVALPESTNTLTVAVTYQGCADAGLCYPPETEYLSVNVGTGSVSTAQPGQPLTPINPLRKPQPHRLQYKPRHPPT